MHSSWLTDRLNDIDAHIVEILTFTKSFSETISSTGDNGVHPKRVNAGEKREEVLSAILNLSDGSTCTVDENAFRRKDRTDSPPNRNSERVITFRDQSKTSLKDRVSNERFSPIVTKILGLLHFRMINTRIQSMHEAHSGTFGWIFQPSSANQSWSDFTKWLQDGEGVYWIKGKAGSGKSSLMKYMQKVSYIGTTERLCWPNFQCRHGSSYRMASRDESTSLAASNPHGHRPRYDQYAAGAEVCEFLRTSECAGLHCCARRRGEDRHVSLAEVFKIQDQD